jgi:hypothetical protein
VRRTSCLVAVAVVGAAAGLPRASASNAPPSFRASVRPLPSAFRSAMSSWRPGCPVAPGELRLLSVTYLGFDGRAHLGRLVVNATAARPLASVFERLYDVRFPIRRIEPVDVYGADDYASIEADNTSAFNCRPATGSSRWSMHAYGLALDLNPLENPYVNGGRTSHPRSRPYLDRSLELRGMVHEGDAVVRAFASIGWGWGGRWSDPTDYQHFSATGR